MALPILPGGSNGSGSGFPTTASGTLAVDGSQKINLRITPGGAGDLCNVTFGLFDISQMTAQTNDPDFAIQALQADKVVLLHTSGQALASQYNLTLYHGGQLGMFILRDATLADYSRGLNPFSPVFSVSGAPGSQASGESDSLIKNASTFWFDNAQSDRVFGASGQMPLDDCLTFAIYGNYTGGQHDQSITLDLPQFDAPAQSTEPTVPEPTTLVLVGLGLAGFVSRRKRTA